MRKLRRGSSVRLELVTLDANIGRIKRRRRGGGSDRDVGVVMQRRPLRPGSITPDDILQPPDDGNSDLHVSYHGGALIPNVSLVLLFWGNAWTDERTMPSADAIANAMQKMLAGPYMSALDQYGIGRGKLTRALIVLSDPPDPFGRDDWHDLIWNLIDQGTFPEPEDDGGRNLYMIVAPPHVKFDDPKPTGAHGYPGDYDFPFDYDVAWGGYVLNDGTLDTVTARLSHEIVEACTDPEDDGWTIDGRSRPNAEIGDVCENTVGVVDGVMVQGYWSQRDRACIIPQTQTLFVPGGGLVAARQPPNAQLTAFSVDRAGSLRLSFEVDNSPWNFPIAITGPGFAPPGAPVAAVQQPPNAQLDAFVIGNDGSVNVLFEVDNSPWSAPIPITPPGFAPPGGHVAAAQQPPNAQLSAFVVDNRGALHVMWEVDNGPWHAPVPLTGVGFAPPGAPVVAVHQPPNAQLDAFVTASDGSVNVLFEVNNGPWSAPIALTPPGFAPPGAKLAVARQPPNQQLTALVVGTNGALHVLWEVDNGPWHAPVPITGAGFAPPGAGIALARQPPNDQLSAFVVDNNGVLNVFFEVDNGPWHGPIAVSAPGFAPPGALVCSVQQPPNAQLDVFVVANDQQMNVLFEVNNSSWSAPIRIS